MNQPDSNEEQDSSQSNPFTSDLKGEFGGGYSGSADASPQVFKEGGFFGGGKSKILMIIGIVIVLGGGGAYFYITHEKKNMDEEFGAANDDAPPANDDEEAAAKKEKTKKKELTKDEGVSKTTLPAVGGEGTQQVAQKEDPAPPAEQEIKKELPDVEGQAKSTIEESSKKSIQEGTKIVDIGKPEIGVKGTTRFKLANSPNYASGKTKGPPAVISPLPSTEKTYDESSDKAHFTWTGTGGGTISFSRDPNFAQVEFKDKVRGNSYALPHLLPGVWYWQVQNRGGSTPVQSFTIHPPVLRALNLLTPGAGSTLPSQGGTVAWTGDAKVTYYRIELSNEGWANPTYRFATSGTQMQINNVKAGAYDMRLGGFSEVSGRWEYTNPIAVTVQ